MFLREMNGFAQSISEFLFFSLSLSHCQNQRHKINSKHSAFLFFFLSLSLSLSKNNRSFRDEAVKKNKKKCLHRRAAHATRATVAFYLQLIHLALCLLLQVSILSMFYERFCAHLNGAQVTAYSVKVGRNF